MTAVALECVEALLESLREQPKFIADFLAAPVLSKLAKLLRSSREALVCKALGLLTSVLGLCPFSFEKKDDIIRFVTQAVQVCLLACSVSK